MTPQAIRTNIFEMIEKGKTEIPGFEYDLALQIVNAHDWNNKKAHTSLEHAVRQYRIHNVPLQQQLYYAMRELYKVSAIELPDNHRFYTMKQTEWEAHMKKKLKFPKGRGHTWQEIKAFNGW